MQRDISAHTFVGNLGQTVTSFTLRGPAPAQTFGAHDWAIQEAYSDASRLVPARAIAARNGPEGALTLEVEPFRYLASDWTVICRADPALSLGQSDVTQVITRTADAFVPFSRDGVPFRLYTPIAVSPRPLMLFLHGGGEGGTDNWLQLVGTLGAAAWAERYPDLMVLAPQNPVAWETVRASFAARVPGASMPGWSLETLDTVATVIRELIAAGEVDAGRVYVSGMSMGGAGTLRMLAHHGELFAGAAPICPSMNEETLPYLKDLGATPVWISSAYRDTFSTRHLQIVDGIENLRALGQREARYTLYSAEELAAYGLGSHPALTDEQRWSENHHSWVLTLNNAYGIMDWLMAQRRITP